MKIRQITKYVLVMALMTGSTLLRPGVSAHQDPAGCTANGGFLGIQVFRSDGSTPIGAGTVESGETIKYQATLAALGSPFCNFDQGTLSITTPDGAVNDVTPGGGIPLVSPGNPFNSALVNYVVSEADVSGGKLQASTQYIGGQSHIGDAHQNLNLGPADIAVNYQDVVLEVTKTALPAFDSECTWDITKEVDVAQHDLLSGDSGTSNYDVTVTSTGCVDSKYRVSGKITIHNPAQFANAVITGVSDSVNGTVATVDCTTDPSFTSFPFNLIPGGTLTCDYTANLPNSSTLTNTATATTSGDVGGGQGTAPVDFTGVNPTTTVNETVNVDDTFFGPLGSCSVGGAPCLFEYERTFTCDEDAGQHDNTATIVETGQTADASVTVTCTPREISCTLTQGYWKTHSEKGPAAHPDETWDLIGGPDTAFFLSGKTWLGVFNTAPKGNAYYNLAHQYMAAVLNQLSGASVPSEVQDALNDAKTLFQTYNPAQIAALKGNNAIRKQFIDLAGILGSYNEGDIGPGHCEESNNNISLR